MKTSFFSVVFFLMFSGIAYAQVLSELNLKLNPFGSVIPNSPEASSLSKYAEFPVSYFYGLPQIDLPIYEINIGDFSFPVSISYHGGGVTVDETASRVGLGWTLNAGGVISRQACGLPDEMLEGSYNNTLDMLADIPVFRGFYHLYSFDQESIRYNMQKSLNYDPSEYKSNFQQLNLYKQIRLGFNFGGGYMDSALDRYTFNFMGYSGVFMMPEASKDSVIMQSGSPVEMVEMNFPEYFVMRDQKDIYYYFEEKETSLYPFSRFPNSGNLDRDSLAYTSAWYLSKIVLPGKDTLYLNYSRMPLVRVESGIYVEKAATYSPNYDHPPIAAGNASQNLVQFFPKRLDKIVSRDAVVSFINDGTPRLDIKRDRTRLDSVKVTDRNGGLIKKMGFRYSYFYNMRYYPSDVNALKLDGIDEFSVSNTDTLPLHRFSYYGDGFRPSKNAGQDHWGYYNGTTDGKVPPFAESVFQGHSRGNRSPVKDEAKYGVLTRMTYPTGGYTDFNWENNTYSYIGTNKVLIEKDEMEYRYLRDTLCGLPEGERLQADVYALPADMIEIDLSEYYYGLGEFLTPWQSYHYNYPGYDPMLGEPEPDFPSVYVYFMGKDKSEQKKRLIWFRLLNKDLQLFPVLKVKPHEEGYYRIELKYPRDMYSDVNEHNILTMFTDYRYYRGGRYGHIPIIRMIPVNSNVRETIALAGGLRIRSISSFSGVDKTITKTFTYGDPYLSSGVLSDFPDYSALQMITYQIFHGDNHFPSRYQNLVRIMTSEGLYNTVFGKPRVEYGWVRESFAFINNPEMVGTVPGIDYYFTTLQDNHTSGLDLNESGYGAYEPPANRMRTSKSHWRGNLKRKIFWDIPGLVKNSKETSYEYLIREDRQTHLFSGGLYMISDFRLGGVMLNPPGYTPERAKSDYGISKFRIIPYNKMVKEQHETTTTPSGEVEETLRYTYPYTEYNKSLQATLPLSKELENSRGEQIVIYYTYFGNTDKVETEVRVENGYITDAVRLEYDGLARIIATYSASLPQGGVPAASYPLGTSLKTSAALKEFLNIKEYEYFYDDRNNLRDIYFKGENLVSFLWAYNGSHPVAEFKKINSEEVDSFLREIGSSRGSFLKESTEVKTKLDRIRALHPDVEMRSLSFHWLIGVASETDNRGVTTYYNYDGYRRLSTIKDYNSYLLKKYTYHYTTR